MKDSGLQRAIDAAGGVGALARALGISQPSVSNWTRIPAERVLAVETLTGVARTDLRPDLYPANDSMPPRTLDEVDRARAQTYLLISSLLRRAPDQAFLERIGRIQGDASEFGMALIGLAEAARDASAEKVGHEFFALFIGVGRGDVLPYGSFYLSGFLHERPLARVREDLLRLGIERAEGDFEPEDHAATLCEVMAGLIDGTFEAAEAEQRAFFDRHMKPWIARFFADLEIAPSAVFYKHVARIGRLFAEIEAESFTIGA